MKITKNIKDNPNCKTFKIPLKKFIKDENYKFILDDAIVRTNKIIRRTYDFIKLYILYCFNNNKELPLITESFIRQCFIIISEKAKKGRKSQYDNDYLENFYKEHYEILLTNKLKPSKKNLTQILKEESKKIKTCFENSISTNYFTFLFRYINCIFIESNNKIINKFEKEEDKKNFIKNLKLELKVVKNDILNNTLNSKIEYHSWIKECYNRIIPSLKNKSYHYDIKCNPLKYMIFLLNMNLELENIGKKMFNSIPLRRSLIPKFIYIDTVVLIDLSDLKNKDNYNKNVCKYQEFIWNKYFNFNSKIFKDKENYTFNYTIQTNGIDTCITFKRKDLKEESNTHNEKKERDEEFEYLENYKNYELLELKNKYNIVYCDPGKCRLLYMMDEEKNKIFKYTNKQRLYETQRLKYENIIKKLKLENGIIEKEALLNNCNSKSVNFNKFKEYINLKENINNDIEEFYLNDIFKKFKMRVFINKQRSEQKLINNINKMYKINKRNIKKEPLIIIGNWSISYQMRNMISSPCLGLKRLLNKNFKMLVMDEFRTSCLNYRTNDKIENMIDKETNKKIHSVLILKEKDKVIGCINRDRNAVNNYKKIFNSYIENGKRPENFERSYKMN